MVRINLLPWREQRRREQQRQFVISLLTVVVVAGALVYGVDRQIQAETEAQQTRNHFLEQEIARIDKRIAKIRDLESTKKKLLARMTVIQELQHNRPLSVHLMDALVRTLPDGVYLTGFSQKGTALKIEGIAQSNARVSNYMRNIDHSRWLTKPRLKVIETQKVKGRRVAVFTLQAQLQANPGTGLEQEAMAQ